jgi:hypothetical protein
MCEIGEPLEVIDYALPFGTGEPYFGAQTADDEANREKAHTGRETHETAIW